MDPDNSADNVVDPEVRAYVYSLVSAVRKTLPNNGGLSTNKSNSWEALGLTSLLDMYWEMMHWHA